MRKVKKKRGEKGGKICKSGRGGWENTIIC